MLYCDVVMIIKKTLAVLLGLIAAAGLVHFVFDPFSRGALEGESVRAVLNCFMAFGIIIAFITVIAAGRVAGTVATNGRPMFYAVTVLGILFFWNWFNELAVGGGSDGQAHGIFWVVVNTVFVVIMGKLASNVGRQTECPDSRFLRGLVDPGATRLTIPSTSRRWYCLPSS